MEEPVPKLSIFGKKLQKSEGFFHYLLFPAAVLFTIENFAK
jgi:hypothetical protein